jgi:hypothetical protein
MSDFLPLGADAFRSLCREIASQLDGTIRAPGDGADDAPSNADMIWIDLANERDGLRVVIRRGLGAERTRLRATMSQTMESRGGPDVDYRETPDFYKLETAAAMSRGARVIAAQIESKIVQPAIPMLEGWKAKLVEKRARAADLDAAAARWQARFPRAKITIDKRNESGEFRLTGGGSNPDSYWYVNARLYTDGRIYIDRMSPLPEDAAAALFAAMPTA